MSHHNIGGAVRARRRLLGLSQSQVSELAGVARRTISDLESGKGANGTTIAKVRAICLVLGLELIVINAESLQDYDDE